MVPCLVLPTIFPPDLVKFRRTEFRFCALKWYIRCLAIGRCSSAAEQLFRKQQVVRSNRIIGSSLISVPGFHPLTTVREAGIVRSRPRIPGVLPSQKHSARRRICPWVVQPQ